jgi:ubiquinol-cytochrome c reductase iron-sulfur subunit
VHRSQEMVARLPSMDDRLADPGSQASDQPDYAQNAARSIRPEYLVVLGVCTHLGCAPMSRFTSGDAELGADWPGGFYCPCHGSKFDLAGRVFKGVPAPTNMAIPPYAFADDNHILVGQDKSRAA